MASAVNNSTYLNQSTYLLADCLTTKNRAKASDETLLDDNATKKQGNAAGVSKSGEAGLFAGNGIKASAVQAEMDNGEAVSATREIEIDDSYYTTNKLMLMKAFTETPPHYIKACEDNSSTPERPLMYVETCEEGVRKAYQIDINKIDLSNTTRAEGIALVRYKGLSGEWDGLTYFKMTEVCVNFAGETGIYNAMNCVDPDFQERINFFEECRKNYVGYHDPSLSVGQTKTAMSALYAAEYDKTLGVQGQFGKVKEVMDKIDQTVNPGNWGQPKQSARRIEDFLLEIGRPWKG